MANLKRNIKPESHKPVIANLAPGKGFYEWIDFNNNYVSDLYGNSQNGDNIKRRIWVEYKLLPFNPDPVDESASGCGNCGSGTGLAFIPLLWLKGRSLFRKYRKKKKK